MKERLHAFKTKIYSVLLSTKITAFLYLTSLLIFLSMEFFVYWYAMSSANNNMIADGTTYCATGAKIADNACSYVRGVADYFSSTSAIQRYFLSPDIDYGISDIIRSHNYLLSAILYTPEGIPIQYMAIDGSSSPVPQSERKAFISFMDRDDDYYWEFIDENTSEFMENDNSPKLCLWRKIHGSVNSRVIGVICVTIDIRRLLRYEVPYTSPYTRDFVILDKFSNTVATDKSIYELGESEYNRILSEINAESGNFPIALEGEEYVAFYERITDTPLFVCYLLAHNSLKSYGSDILQIMLVSVMVYLSLIIPLVTIVSIWLTKPLNKLKQSIDSFSDGNFDIRLSFHTNDEIGKLGKAFNNMVEKNKQLIDETYVAQIRRKEAELLLQQAQINPHFIYNLVNSMQWSALKKGEKDLAEMANSLGQLMRLSLNRGNSMLPVSKECELVSCFLKLQKNKYQERLKYTIECTQEAGETIIPKLIIQPLVENSIVHGMASSTSSISIRIKAFTEGSKLIINVTDDGIGIQNEILALLPDRYSSDSKDSSGFAIKNIHDRLQLIYNDEFTFRISNLEPHGTAIEITLPISYKGANDVQTNHS